MGAAIVAGGLVLSASLYPLPGQRPFPELWQEEHGLSSGLPNLVESVSANQIIDLANVELPALVHLAQIVHDDFQAIRPDVLLMAVEKYGLPEVVRSLEVLAATGLPTIESGVNFGGGAGGGSGSGSGSGTPPPIMLPDFALLFAMLMQQLPSYLVQELGHVIAALFPALISTSQVQHMGQVLNVTAPTAYAAPPAVTTISPLPLEIPSPAPVVPPPPPPPVTATFVPPAPVVESTIAPSPEVPPPPMVEIPLPPSPPPLLSPDIGTDVTPSPTTPDVEPPQELGPDESEEPPNTADNDREDSPGSGDSDAPGAGDEGSAGGDPGGGSPGGE